MDWAPIVTAIATATIAIVAVGFAAFGLPMVRQAARVSAALEQLLLGTKPLLETAKSIVSEAGQVAVRLRTEVDGIVETSQDVRERVLNAAEAAEDRLIDIEALLDVLQDEVEDTALDVAAALRTTRRGTAIFGAMKRAFLGSGKKRRRKR